MKSQINSKYKELLSKYGLIGETKALILIDSSGYDAEEIFKRLKSKNLFFFREQDVKQVLIELEKEKLKEELSNNKNNIKEKPVEVHKSRYILAKDINPEIKIYQDASNGESRNGDAQDFIDYFNVRYKKLVSLFPSTLNLNPISKVDKNKRQDVWAVGIVYEKSITRNGDVRILLEDEEGMHWIYVNKDNPMYEIAQKILEDDVIAVHFKNGVIDNIRYPDIPEIKPNTTEEDIYVAFISDWHVGSISFLKDRFKRFIEFLNGKWDGTAIEKAIIDKIKYLVISGDVVDGVGIYPGQELELTHLTIEEQYEEVAKYIEQIPEYITIIIQPGNHDAVRRHEPQPRISKDFAKPLYTFDNVVMVGNPCSFSIHGVNIFSYHGTSFDEIIGRRSDLDYTHPTKVMEEYLKRRHVVPSYGFKSPIVPDRKRDYLIIDPVPDVFVCGHVHYSAEGYYKNTALICASCWQDITKYQEEWGHVPQPGIVHFYNMKSRNIINIQF